VNIRTGSKQRFTLTDLHQAVPEMTVLVESILAFRESAEAKVGYQLRSLLDGACDGRPTLVRRRDRLLLDWRDRETRVRIRSGWMRRLDP
jgi:hypothetical protein